MSSKRVTVDDNFQKGYTYYLSEPEGKNYDPEFGPTLTPKEMLELGVFGGVYFEDEPEEFPNEWYTNMKSNRDGKKHPELNYFQVGASQSHEVWKKKGWIYKDDPRGWFQWYARYYMGRRIPEEDKRQIKRWKAFRRHLGQIQKNCREGDLGCRRKQRQALMHWAYDSRRF